MRIPRHYTLIQRMRDARLKQCVPRCAPLAASLVRQSRNRSGRQLTLEDRGKTRTVYVPRELVTEVQQWAREFKHLKQLVRKVTKQNLAIIRRHVAVRRAENRARLRKAKPSGINSRP